MRWLLLLACLSTAAVLASGLPSRASAQDPAASGPKGARPAGSKKGGQPEKATKADLEKWNKLVARRDEIEKEVAGVDKKIGDATQKDRMAIIQRLQQLQGEYQTELAPTLVALAPKIFAADPTDPVAAEIVLETWNASARYPDVLAGVEKVLAAGKSTVPILAQKARAQFSTNDFEGAKKTLEEAKERDPKVFARLTALLTTVNKYIGLWADEAARREKEAEADDLPRVRLKTARGDIVVELFENDAPNTVANFVSLTEGKKYDGVAFHRVEPGFVIQGGDPNTLDGDPSNDGKGGPGYSIACECYRDDTRKHFAGSLSMAHAGRDTGGSQFFITHAPTPHLNYEKGNASNHTVFGRVIEGMDVVLAIQKGDRIEKATVLRKRAHEYVPEKLADTRRQNPAKSTKPAEKK